ncbi:fungal-specific transcription factor domain-containing protein [Podospora appendiculata]|uniref:Fungal-specific transcription factor domain-containing protein n=1 Tax=Podospora appendiculata TaxID=314037 RepID=A0AAE1CBX9_9PEZI|nr:fungal-specific transcription factor domain-containing protein [Podospora appendiculata]
MDAADIFRQGLGSVLPRPPQHFYPRKPPFPIPYSPEDAESDAPHRIAHTLTACCRCRQRKTRCDATLPRCLPCERSGSPCEYFDTTKGRKISRHYVVKLQEKVRQLEAELSQYTDEDNEGYPHSHEDMLLPGSMVRLSQADETPRYLGPSSGIAMTRLLMEEAKRYTETKRIADLVPELHTRRQDRGNRMQSVVSMMGSISGPAGRKRNYPKTSAHPAQQLPNRAAVDKLVEAFNKKAQVFTPTLHETVFAQNIDDVFDGDRDPYKNFVVHMVLAITLQKVDSSYAGLADSYYRAAMQHFEDVVRPKDLKTLQCLILIGQYALLTPTRTALYYVAGLATRICQQLGLGEEKTIALGITDPQTLDMRRRLSWIVTSNELGLADIMGRPNGFAKGKDLMDVKFFETVDDQCITPEGIQPGPPSERKMIAIHVCRMHILQGEIRRVLYETKKPEPSHNNHPWFSQMEHKLEEWLHSSPKKPDWCRPWFTGRYHSMIVCLYRPSPQVPKPTSFAAMKCFEGANYIINLSSQQVKKAAVDITWVFLVTLYMSLNTLLWTLSYPEIRAKNSREDVEGLVNIALEIIDQCSERWPGSSSASRLYRVFARACMQSYDVKEESTTPTSASGLQQSGFNTPPSLGDGSSPDSVLSTQTGLPTGSSIQQGHSHQQSFFNTSPFGYVFGSDAEEMATQYAFDSPFQNQPTFRSNSIFLSPGTELNGRRFSHFAPDFTNSNEGHFSGRVEDTTPPQTHKGFNAYTSSSATTPTATALPTPPESLAPPSAKPSNPSLSPKLNGDGFRSASPTPTPTMRNASPTPTPASLQPSALPMPALKYEPADYSQTSPQVKQEPGLRTPAFTIPPPPQPNTQQRHLPITRVTDWFSPPPPFISPHSFSGGMNTGYWGDGSTPTPFMGLGLSGNESYIFGGGRSTPGGGPGASNGMDDGQDFDMFANGDGYDEHSQYPFSSQGRQGSLTQEQQLELMNVLETEGMHEIDAFLNVGMDVNIRWN